MAVVKGNYFLKVKTNCFYSQLNYSLPRTAIEAEIHFQALYIRVQRLKTSLTKCQTRYCIEPRPSVDDCRIVRLLRTTNVRVGSESGKTPLKENSSAKRLEVGSVDSTSNGKIINGFSRFPVWSNRLRVQ